MQPQLKGINVSRSSREDDGGSVRLPGAENATIDDEKIRDYLLSRSHPVGRFKAHFFGSLGYLAHDWELLRDDLLALARSSDAVEGQASAYGQKYEVRGTLDGPTGRSAVVVTVWLIPTGEDAPRLVTAFPGEIR